MTDPTRREFIGATASGVGAAATPLSILTRRSDTLTEAAAASLSGVASLSVDAPHEDIVIQKYGGNPAWNIEHTNRSALDDWIASSDDRQHVRDLGDGRVTVAAPPEDIADSVLNGSALETDSYVNSIDIDFVASYAAPVTRSPSSAKDDWPPQPGTVTRALMGRDSYPDSTDGVAFDTEQTTLADVRAAVNVDAVSETGSGTTLAVIDTGVNDGAVFEDDLGESRILPASKSYVEDGDPTVEAEGMSAVADGNGHGTWVAACTASNASDSTYLGVAPEADILALRALNDDGEGSTSQIAAAVRYAADQSADVICMSLGSPIYSDELDDALDDARENGTLPIVAAGNDRYGTRFVNTPASSEHTMAVGATTTATDPATVESAYFSNVSPQPGTQDFSDGATAGGETDIGAPGMSIEAEVPGGYETLSGTSMACPVVAGVALLVVEAANISPDDLQTRLEDAAAPVEQLAAAEAEAGLVDAPAAVAGDEQETAMDSAAESRDVAYRAESESRGNSIAKYLR